MKKKNNSFIMTIEHKKQIKTNKDKMYQILEYISINYNVNIMDIKLGDGYFIFDMGKNSVCHFKIKQLKKWQFGIWLEQDKDKKIYAEIFAQPINNIDKFKPLRSYYNADISIQEVQNNLINEALYNMLKEMKKHPIISWCLDYGCISDENHRLTGCRALYEYISFRYNEIKRKFNNKLSYLIIINYLKSMKYLKKIINYKITDRNKIDNELIMYPRYEINILAELKYADKIDNFIEKISKHNDDGCDIYTCDNKTSEEVEEWNKKILKN